MPQSQPVNIAPTKMERKTYFPFKYMLRSAEYQGVGACLAENCYIDSGRLRKIKGQDVYLDTSTPDEIIWIHEYQKQDGTFQTLYAYLSGAVYKLRAIDSDGTTILTPGTEIKTQKTGTVDALQGSPTISGTLTSFTTEFAVDDWIEVDPGDGEFYQIESITSDTIMVLKTNYAGANKVGSDIYLVEYPYGEGDIEFTSSNFDMTQIGDYGYISNESPTTPGYQWNGVSLRSITNMPKNPKFIVRDGNRIATNKVFSGETVINFTDGSAVQSDGDYATSLEPYGAVEAGAGIILFGKRGAESHKVIPNNASDNVSAKTKADGFSYTGLGVENTHQVCAGKNSVYFLNSEGINEMNPYTGQTVNLTDTGNIKRRWEEYDLSNSFISYDEKNDRVVAVVKSRGQNDTMIVIDADKQEKPISMATGAFYSSMTNVNGTLRGGSSHDGRIVDVFETYTDRDGTTLQFRYIIEWDALTNPMLEKRLKRFAIFANLNPQSSFTVNLYKDGYHEPIKTETFTTTAATGTAKVGSTIGEWGKYVFSLGGERDYSSSDLNSDKMKRVRKNTKCSTFALEIIENSFYDFTVNEIFLEYKTKGRLIRNQTMPNTLF